MLVCKTKSKYYYSMYKFNIFIEQEVVNPFKEVKLIQCRVDNTNIQSDIEENKRSRVDLKKGEKFK